MHTKDLTINELKNNDYYVPITVIIPAYNIANYIIETIDSVLAQNLKPNEIIVIDDGSTDNTVELLSEAYKDNKLIKIITQRNKGAGEARNLGIKLSASEFIFFCDSDDIIAPGLFEEFNNRLHENNTLDLFCFSSKLFFENGTNVSKVSHNTSDWFTEANDILADLLINGDYTAASWTYIVRKKIIIDNNLGFKGRIHEDHEITITVYLACHTSYRTTKVFYLQRYRTGSLTRSHDISIANLIDRIDAFNSALDIIGKQDYCNFNKINLIRSKYINWSLFSLIDMCVENFNYLPDVVKDIFKLFKDNPTSTLKEKIALNSPNAYFFLKKIYLLIK